MNSPPSTGLVAQDSYGMPVRRRWWPVISVVAVIAIGTSLISPTIRHQWALSLFRQRTNFTILYFNEPATLPTSSAGHAPITFSFSIKNQEGRDVRYRYVVHASDGLTASHLLATGSKLVLAGRPWTVPLTVVPRCLLSPCYIKVSLPAQHEAIDFRVVLKPKGA
jgi:hypothetical protein